MCWNRFLSRSEEFISQYGQRGFGGRLAESEEIQIPSGAVRIVEPGSDEHRSFEDEAVSMRRIAEAIQ